MPALTRRRDSDRHQESWRVFYGDIEIGRIGQRAGVPVDVEQWGWQCGFSPAIDRCLRAGGTAATLEQARADFAEAWANYLPRCTEADFEGYRRQRAWTAWKYEMHETGCKLPTEMPELRSRRFCGMAIDSATMDQHVFTNHMAA
jgi:hypothetical protein